MNQITRDIMKLLGVDQTTALKIQNHMDRIFQIDYSECSTRTLNKAIRSAAQQLACQHEWDTTMTRDPMCIYCGAAPTAEDIERAG